MKLQMPPETNGESSLTLRRSILVVDDHPIFRHALTDLLGSESDLMVCAEAANAAEALDAMRTTNPDAAVIDVSLPGANGIELVKMMRAEQPNLPILMLSLFEES